MKTATLKGKTLKGKNRIREHGNVWKIILEKDDSICVESLKNPNMCRWIDIKNDVDMEIVEMTGAPIDR